MKKIGFLGAGSIAEAMVSGGLQSGFVTGEQLWVTNRSNEERLLYWETTYGVNTTRDTVALVQNCDILFLLMKPQDVATSLQPLKAHIRADQLIISVLAGVTIDTIAQIIEQNCAIVRTMPNTSAKVRLSATAYSMSTQCTAEHRAWVESWFRSFGVICEVEEQYMNLITGLSGSGPAYVYYMIEQMIEGAMKLGLDEPTARSLTYHTVYGAAHMLMETDDSPRTLRLKVTSPNGTTAAGIRTLDQYDVSGGIQSCIQNATTRAAEMSDELILKIGTSK
ncbi:MAG: pyrroline-5-carboxylate reductase [Bacilli bacterium]